MVYDSGKLLLLFAKHVVMLSLDSHLNVCVFKCDTHLLLFDTDFKILAFNFFASDVLPRLCGVLI